MLKLESFFLVAISVVILSGCEGPQLEEMGKPDPPATQSMEAEKSFFLGDSVYHGKHLFKYSEDDLYFKAERFSISNLDTFLAPNNLHAVVSYTDTTRKKVASTTYYFFVDKGEQYKLPVNSKANAWLNSGSILKPTFMAGKIKRFELLQGEAYFETLDTAFINISEDSLALICNRGTAFNVKDYHNEKSIVISVAKGTIKVYRLNDTGYYLIMNQGEKLKINRATLKGRLDTCDITKIGDWREARFFRLSDANIPMIMEAINRWYKTTTIYEDPMPTESFEIAFPYQTPIDTVLKRVEIVAPVQLKRNNDTIFISIKK